MADEQSPGLLHHPWRLIDGGDEGIGPYSCGLIVRVLRVCVCVCACKKRYTPDQHCSSRQEQGTKYNNAIQQQIRAVATGHRPYRPWHPVSITSTPTGANALNVSSVQRESTCSFGPRVRCAREGGWEGSGFVT